MAARVTDCSCLAQSGTLCALELGGYFDGLSVGWCRCLRGQQPRCAGVLNHSVPEDQWIDDVAARYTTPSPHPHRNATFSNIDQVVDDHQTFTLGASHGTS